jgi:hypothetical protein
MRFCWDCRSWRSRIGTNFTSESRGNVWDFAEWLTLSKTVVMLSLCSSVQFWYRFSVSQSEANCCGYHGWSAHQVPMSTGQLYPPSRRVATVRCAPCPKLASCIFCTFGYLLTSSYFNHFDFFDYSIGIQCPERHQMQLLSILLFLTRSHRQPKAAVQKLTEGKFGAQLRRCSSIAKMKSLANSLSLDECLLYL